MPATRDPQSKFRESQDRVRKYREEAAAKREPRRVERPDGTSLPPVYEPGDPRTGGGSRESSPDLYQREGAASKAPNPDQTPGTAYADELAGIEAATERANATSNQGPVYGPPRPPDSGPTYGPPKPADQPSPLGAAAEGQEGQSDQPPPPQASDAQPKRKGLRGRIQRRRTVVILSLIGGGGGSGLLLGALMFLGPTFGLTDMVRNITDFELGPTENIQARRQTRILYDFIKNGRQGVENGVRTGRYLGRTGRAWRDFNMGRFALKAQAQGWRVEFLEDLRDTNGRLVNVDRNGQFKRRVPSRIITPQGRILNLAQDGVLTTVSQSELREFTNRMMRDVYPGNVLGAARRAHYRGFLNAVTGFRWGKFFQEEGGKALARAYGTIFDTDARANAEIETDGTTGQDADGDGQPDPIPNEDGSPIDQNAVDNTNDARSTLLMRIAAGASPREAFRTLSTALFGSFRAALGTSSIVLAMASLACLAQSIYEGDVEAQWNRYASVMNYGGFLLGVADEILNGGFVSLEDLGDLYNEFISYKRIVVDDAGNWVEIVKSIGNSATIQRSNGNEVIDGEELLASNYVEVDRNAAYRAFAAVGSVVSVIPSSAGFCSFLNSAWGQALGFLAGLVECVATGGVLCVASEVGAELALHIWGDDLFNALFGLSLNELGVTGMAFVPQSAEVFAQSASLINSEQSRSGIPISNEQYNEVVAQYMDERKEEVKELPIMERYFAVSTPGSLGQQVALWRTEARHKSFLDNAASLLRMPFDAFGSLFSTPLKAQEGRTKCLSENDYRTIDEGGNCVEHDNFKFQKYSYDVVIQCNGTNINLLDGWNTEDPDDNNYGMDWVEAQVLSIVDSEGNAEAGDTDLGTIEPCAQFQDQSETALKIAEVCHGLIFSEDNVPALNPGAKYSLYSDPQQYGTEGADDRNNDVKRYCKLGGDSLLDDVDLRQLYALIGAYADYIYQIDGFLLASGEAIDVPVPSGIIPGVGSGNPTPISGEPPDGCVTPDQTIIPTEGTCIGVPSTVVLEPYIEGATIDDADQVIELNTPGEVINGKEIFGCIDVRAPNVIIQNSRIHCYRSRDIAQGPVNPPSGDFSTGYDGAIQSSSTNLLVTNNTISCTAVQANITPCDFGIDGSNFIARFNNMFGMVDAFAPNGNVSIEYNYVHNLHVGLEEYRGDLAHADGVQTYAGNAGNITIRGNHFQGASSDGVIADQLQGIFVGTGIGPVTITENFLEGYWESFRIGCLSGSCDSTGNVFDDAYIGRNVIVHSTGVSGSAGCNRHQNGSLVTQAQVRGVTVSNANCGQAI